MKPTFRTRLLASYVFLVVVPLVTAGIIFYTKSLQVVTGQARQNVQSILIQNNEVIDTKLGFVERNSQSLFVDRELFEIFNTLDPADESELLQADRRVNSVLRSYFSLIEDVYAYQLWTSYFTFGQSLPQGRPQESDIYREAVEAGGRMIWYPTYDFADMFGQDYLGQGRLDFRYLYSATRVVDFTYQNDLSLERMKPEVERPVLVVSFKAESLMALFEQSIPPGSSYLILDQDNSVVAGSDREQISQRYASEWVDELQQLNSGTKRMTLDGETVIVCYDRSRVTGWLSIVITPQSALVAELVPAVRNSTLLLSLLMIVVALAFAYVISGKITNPIKRLVGAMRSVGEGDFHTRLAVRDQDEFGLLMQRFNRMNDRIRRLVTENYESRLKEQEAEIRALNMQMNPHFLYNTLNVMNWTAIENGQRELSKMLICLSHMLQYTARKEWDAVTLAEELDWMRSYFFIMAVRFEDKFAVAYDIDPVLQESKLPRLLFQPFVENAILHGFAHLETGGVISIRGWREGEMRRFAIEDNGIGMDSGTVERILYEPSASIGIQNTIARIRLAYGEPYGIDIVSSPGQGTTIFLTLPL
ncbi:cache domain-containing sensor histidine kinase [Paenibacillus sp. 1P07SE]|uniref:cache domain-containing sensor histidine kinase n=1 Tax=Paenibacillus sp. 1P07SE TaxID=3132209 RepID=UPI0039A60910